MCSRRSLDFSFSCSVLFHDTRIEIKKRGHGRWKQEGEEVLGFEVGVVEGQKHKESQEW